VKAIPLNILTLYADLDQTLRLVTEPAGSIYRHTVKGRTYVYVSVRQGTARIKRYLGADGTPETQAKITAVEDENVRAANRRELVRMLKSLGLPGPTTAVGRVLDVVASAGLFGNGAVLVGMVAYQCMSPLVGHHLPIGAMMTQDADLASSSLALAALPETTIEDGTELATTAAPTLETILKRADPTFRGLPNLDRKALLPARFQAQSGLMIEVLVPRLRRMDPTPMAIKPLGAGGLPLQQLDWLIKDPVNAVSLHGEGIPVRVPQPARYAVHKMIIAQKPERNAQKRPKDLEQARALIEALRLTDPVALEDAVEDARSLGKKGWAEPIQASLDHLGLTL
jgi:hypothetical protein